LVFVSRLPAVIRVKFPADVGVVEGPAMKIGRLERGGGGKFPEERSATLGRFVMTMSEIERAVLR
jgi:hypothetical protein